MQYFFNIRNLINTKGKRMNMHLNGVLDLQLDQNNSKEVFLKFASLICKE